MVNKVKAFASDFDGTLLINNKIKETDVEAINELQSNGILFGMCSGRPFSGLLSQMSPDVKLDFYILSTGTLIMDKDFHILYEDVLTRSLVKDIVKKYNDKIEILIQANKDMYVFKDNGIPREWFVIKSIDEIIGDSFYSMSMMCKSEDEASELKSLIEKEYKGIDVFQNRASIDIVKEGNSKGNAIRLLKKLLNINEIAGIGDSYNDISMLDNVDKSYTFHDSPCKVKEHADYHVNSVAEAISMFQNK